MENIRNIMDNLKMNIQNSDKIDSEKEIINILDLLINKVEELELKQQYLEENFEYIDDDLTDIQEELFQELSIDDLSQIEDEYIEVSCKNCDKPLFVEKDVLEKKEKFPCPFCKEFIN